MNIRHWFQKPFRRSKNKAKRPLDESNNATGDVASSSRDMAAIGIDLGTTYSCVAAVVGGEVKILQNSQGNFTTPSYVAFKNEGGLLVGEAAKSYLPENPKNTIFNVKRFIGRSWEDPTVQTDMRNYPFELVEKEKKLHVEITRPKEKRQRTEAYLPEVIGGMFLKHLKEIAEKELGKQVCSAVITIPASFNDAQRRATTAAAKYAGLAVIKLLAEPTAAALAYHDQFGTDTEKNLLVFDFGGGTLDVTVLTVDNKSFKVKAVTGNTHLGGEDFDKRMMNSFIADFGRNKGVDLTKDEKAKSRLKFACEEAKKMLSTEFEEEVCLDSLSRGVDFSATIMRASFEDMNDDLFSEALGYVKDALKDAEFTKSQIDKVIIVGGSSRIPWIQNMLNDFFGKEVTKSINPDEAIAWGAAIVAAQESGNIERQLAFYRNISDVTPLSLGIETRGGKMNFIIERNTEYPTKKHRQFTTVHDNQTSAKILIYEGQESQVAFNHLLGEFTLKDIRAERAGKPKIKVYFEIDTNCILNVSAHDLKSGVRNCIKIDYNGRRQNDPNIVCLEQRSD